MRKLGLVAAAAFIATPLMALPHGPAPARRSRAIAPVRWLRRRTRAASHVMWVAWTFSNFAFSPALVTITGITSYSSGGEFGLDLFFSSSPTPSVNADIGWNFSVSEIF